MGVIFRKGRKKRCKSRNYLIYTCICGERGIRTPGTSRYVGFQDRCNRPLCHLSKVCFLTKMWSLFVWWCKGISKKYTVQIFWRKNRFFSSFFYFSFLLRPEYAVFALLFGAFLRKNVFTFESCSDDRCTAGEFVGFRDSVDGLVKRWILFPGGFGDGVVFWKEIDAQRFICL